jgi:hypothetical protein
LERNGVLLVAVVSRTEDLPDPAVVVVNPDEEVTPEVFREWLDLLQSGEPLHLGITAAQTLAEARAAGEV